MGRLRARDDVDAARGARASRSQVVALAGGEPRTLAPTLGPLAAQPGLAAGQRRRCSSSADDDGRGPVFRIDLASDEVTRLTSDDATFTDVQRQPGRLDGVRAADVVRGAVAPGADRPGDRRRRPRCASPVATPELPGTLTEVETTADGRPTRARVAGAARGRRTKAPLLLWIHGGPLGSWNAWSWRWNPWILVARGYAVLLPDPALSTGYGQDFVQDGWGAWGARAVHGPAGDHRRGGARATTSTRPARRRWAARSAATWPTGWPATPTGSARSSRTRACGRWTSSARRRTRRSTGGAR